MPTYGLEIKAKNRNNNILPVLWANCWDREKPWWRKVPSLSRNRIGVTEIYLLNMKYTQFHTVGKTFTSISGISVFGAVSGWKRKGSFSTQLLRIIQLETEFALLPRNLHSSRNANATGVLWWDPSHRAAPGLSPKVVNTNSGFTLFPLGPSCNMNTT